MKISVRILLICVLVLSLLAACSGGPNYNLYGTWRNETGSLTLIFQQNGHVLIQQQGAVQNQVFQFTGPDTILMKAYDGAPADQSATFNYSINGNSLVLVVQAAGQDPTQGAQNQTISLTRVK